MILRLLAVLAVAALLSAKLFADDGKAAAIELCERTTDDKAKCLVALGFEVRWIERLTGIINTPVDEPFLESLQIAKGGGDGI